MPHCFFCLFFFSWSGWPFASRGFVGFIIMCMCFLTQQAFWSMASTRGVRRFDYRGRLDVCKSGVCGAGLNRNMEWGVGVCTYVRGKRLQKGSTHSSSALQRRRTDGRRHTRETTETGACDYTARSWKGRRNQKGGKFVYVFQHDIIWSCANTGEVPTRHNLVNRKHPNVKPVWSVTWVWKGECVSQYTAYCLLYFSREQSNQDLRST